MEVAYLSAISALAGSLVGGLATGLTTWMSLRAQTRVEHLVQEKRRRQDLFKDFIVAAANTYGHALVSNEPKVEEFVGIYAMISRMRVLCSPAMVACAEEVTEAIVETYFGPNRSLRELHEMIKSDASMDPLKKFSEMARDDLEHFSTLLR